MKNYGRAQNLKSIYLINKKTGRFEQALKSMTFQMLVKVLAVPTNMANSKG